MTAIECPVCGERVEAEVGGSCAECGAILSAELFLAGRREIEQAAEPSEQPVGPAPINVESADELLTAFREQFDRHQIHVPAEWSARLRSLATEVEPSRRLASVIFVDLRGYTRMTTNLTEQQLDRLHHWFYEICTRRIELHGGFVVRFIGDAVYAAFGAPASFERDSEAALRTLLEIREDVRELGRFEGQELAIRAGANTGMVSVRPIEMQGRALFDLFGSAVNLAARLQDHAETWDILISDTMADQVRGSFVLEMRDPFLPKNFARQVTPWAVVAHKGTQAVRRWQETRLVGRVAELEQLLTWIGRARRGGVAFAQIAGEPGVGKTRLVQEALARQPGERLETAIISCEPHTRHMLLEAALKLLRAIAASTLPEPISKELSPQESFDALRTAFPRLNDFILPNLGYVLGLPAYRKALQSLPTEQLRVQVITSLTDVVTAACAEKPWVIFLDDAQWCDRLSWEVIELLIRNRPAGLCILAAGRFEPEELDPIDFSQWEKIAIHPLDKGDMTDLLEQIIDPSAIHPLVKLRLIKETEGIPLYLVELARQIPLEAQQETVSDLAPVRRMDHIPGIPPLLFDVLQTRIDQLGAQKRALLQCGAVLGRRFSYRLLELFQQLHVDLLDELMILKSLRMLRDEPMPQDIAFFFTPTVLRDVAYQMLTADQKIILHRNVAVQIEKRYANVLEGFYYELAFHWLHAEEPARAQRFFKKAAEQAISRGSPVDAYELVQRALATSANPSGLLGLQQNGLLQALAGQACRLIGNYEKSNEHLGEYKRIAEAMGNSRWLHEVAYQMAVNLNEQGEYEQAEDLFSSALDKNGRDSLFRARVLQALGAVRLRRGRLDEALSNFSEVIELLGRFEQVVPTTADAWTNSGLIHWHRGDRDQAESCFNRGLDLWRRMHHLFGEIHALSNLGMLAEEQGDLPRALDLYGRAGRQAVEIGYLRGITTIEANRSNISLLLQDWREAQRQAALALHAARVIGHRYSEGVALENLGLALAGMGLYDEARKALEEAIAIGAQTRDPMRTDSARMAQAWTALSEGRLDLARQSLRELAPEISPDLRSWRDTIDLTLSVHKDGSSVTALVDSLKDLELNGTLENYLRRLDALIWLADRQSLSISRGDLEGLRQDRLGAVPQS